MSPKEIISSEEIEEQICLQNLKILLNESENKFSVRINDSDFLLRFVRVRKCDSERAFQMLKNYYQLMKKNDGKYFKNLTPSVMKPLFDLGMHIVLKERDPLGRKVYLFRVGLWDFEKTSVDQIITSTTLILEEMVNSEETQKNGVIFVADQTGLSFQHFRQFSVKQILSIIAVLQGNFPLKCKGLHSVNEPIWLKNVVSFAKPFVSKKLQKRVHFHAKDLTSFQNFFPRQMLPEALGGNVATWEEANDKEFFQTLYSREDYYKRYFNNA